MAILKFTKNTVSSLRIIMVAFSTIVALAEKCLSLVMLSQLRTPCTLVDTNYLTLHFQIKYKFLKFIKFAKLG